MRNTRALIPLITIVLMSSAALLGADDRPADRWKILVPRSASSLPLLSLDSRMREQRTSSLGATDAAPELEVDFFSNHAQAMALLLRGDADMILTGTSQGWENHLGGGPVVMAATGIWGVSSLIGREPGFGGIADLRGRSIAVPFPGAPLDVQMRVVLEAAGLNPARDVEIVYSPPVQTVARLLKGQVDVAPLPEPLASNLVLRKGLHRLIEMKDAWARVSGGDPLSPQVSLFVTRSSARASRFAVEAVVGMWREASAWVTDHPREAAEIFSPVLELPSDVLAEAIANTVYLVPEPAENERRVRAYFETVKRFSSTPGGGTLEPGFFF